MKKNTTPMSALVLGIVTASFVTLSTQVCSAAVPQWVTWDASVGGNGHSYLAVPGFSGLTWNMANTLAQQQGGTLATLTSDAENNFVFGLVNSPQFFSGFNGSGPALGGLQADGVADPAAGWSWVTGEAWSYTHWLAGRPDDSGPGPEDRLHYFSDVGGTPSSGWNDIYQTDSNIGGYVVEVVPEPSSAMIFGWAAAFFVRRAVKKARNVS